MVKKLKATDEVYDCLISSFACRRRLNLQRQEEHTGSFINGWFKEQIEQNLNICSITPTLCLILASHATNGSSG
jgi:hypothetical protein